MEFVERDPDTGGLILTESGKEYLRDIVLSEKDKTLSVACSEECDLWGMRCPYECEGCCTKHHVTEVTPYVR
jgi:hypothetical protein